MSIVVKFLKFFLRTIKSWIFQRFFPDYHQATMVELVKNLPDNHRRNDRGLNNPKNHKGNNQGFFKEFFLWANK